MNKTRAERLANNQQLIESYRLINSRSNEKFSLQNETKVSSQFFYINSDTLSVKTLYLACDNCVI